MATKKRGRPPKPASEQRTWILRVGFTPREAEALKAAAKKADAKVPAWAHGSLMLAAMGAGVPAPIDRKSLQESIQRIVDKALGKGK